MNESGDNSPGIHWNNVWENYLAAIGAVVTLYAIYRLFGHDMIGLKK